MIGNRHPVTAPTASGHRPVDGSAGLQAPPEPVIPSRPTVPTEQLPVGWKDFRSLNEAQQLNRVTAAMAERNLPADVLAFFEKEILDRSHMDVTRNNMANALVWQETPNPQLHTLFAKMLEDKTENPVWRDYCLQFLSECLKSTAEPEAVKAVLSRYAQGKDGLAGTAIVTISLQEGEGRMRPDENFSKQLEGQLADPEVATPTKLSILGVIGRRQDVRLLPLVRTYARDRNDGLRRSALATLGLIGVSEDLPLVQSGLSDPNRAVQLAAKAAEARLRSW
jgi:HEAT repeat protein